MMTAKVRMAALEQQCSKNTRHQRYWQPSSLGKNAAYKFSSASNLSHRGFGKPYNPNPEGAFCFKFRVLWGVRYSLYARKKLQVSWKDSPNVSRHLDLDYVVSCRIRVLVVGLRVFNPKP